MPNTATLLVCCPDRKGIVASLAQTLYGHGANILDADQHTDPQANQFFQRIRMDLTDLHTDKVSLLRAVEEVAERHSMQWRLATPETPKRVALFVSKYDHCLYDILLRHQSGELHCEIPFIISNHETLRHVAKQFNIPYHIFTINKDNKAEQEALELNLLREHNIDCVVLARYMQILSKNFLEQYGKPVINIHHSFLPAFMGGKPYHRAYERGVKLIGATAHYATHNLDEGPIIEQDVVRTSHRDHINDLIRKGRDLEKVVLARALRLHLEDRILVYNNKTVVFE